MIWNLSRVMFSGFLAAFSLLVICQCCGGSAGTKHVVWCIQGRSTVRRTEGLIRRILCSHLPIKLHAGYVRLIWNMVHMTWLQLLAFKEHLAKVLLYFKSEGGSLCFHKKKFIRYINQLALSLKA